MSLPTTTSIPPRASSINKSFNSNTHDLKKSKRSKEENFELEDNDNWPEEIGLGNIIGDLDADIDRQTTMSASSSPMQGSSSSSTSASTKSNSSKLSTMTTINSGSGAGGGSATATITQTQQHSSSSNNSSSSNKEKDKGLKMKIKRTKTGCRNDPDGKLEIVQQHPSSANTSDVSSGSGGGSSNPSPLGGTVSPVSNGNSSSDAANARVPLNAAEIMAAASAAVSKQKQGNSALTGGKIRLNSSTANSSSSTISSKSQASGGNKASGVTSTSSSKHTNGANSSGSSDNTNISNNGNGDNTKVNSKLNSKNGCGSGGSGSGNGGKDSDKHRGDKNRGGGASASTNKVQEPPLKKQKTDASVGTEMGTMTEPDCIGPLDPGTSVTLEGIVWHETDGGVLVINVTWRGKTYVGTLLDSTRHVNQWAPPRDSDSPVSDSRAPKGRGKRGRGATGTPIELETRKNLRSSKGKGRLNQTSNQGVNSPSKRKGRPNDDDKSDDNKKRQRTDSSRTSPDDDDDSEKEQKDSKDKDKGNESDDKESTSSVRVKEEKDDDELMPKDEEEKRYIPPPPLPYSLSCPKPGCKKSYRHKNGLRFHVSHSHPELINAQGEILDATEIEKMATALKSETMPLTSDAPAGQHGNALLKGDEHEASTTTDSSASAASSKTSTPGPNDTMPGLLPPSSDISSNGTDLKVGPQLLSSQSNLLNSNGKVIGTPAGEGLLPGQGIRPAGSTKSNPFVPSSLAQGNLAPGSNGNFPGNGANNKPQAKPIRPPPNARPIVPAVAPQIIPGVPGQTSSALKPIQPRPTILPEPTPNLSLDELRKSKKDLKNKHKKDSTSPGSSPPRSVPTNIGSNPSSSQSLPTILSQPTLPSDTTDKPAKSPAYSDISDDGDDSDKRNDGKLKVHSSLSESLSKAPPLGASSLYPTSLAGSLPPNAASVPFSPYGLPPSSQGPNSANLAATAGGNSDSQQRSSESIKKDGLIRSGPQPGSIEYEKMLQGYGFPPFPYPVPPGMDPSYHIHLLTTDPVYKQKYEKDRAEKEKAFKEQIDRDNREKDRKAGVKSKENDMGGTPGVEDLSNPSLHQSRPDSRPNSTPTISVKPEFRAESSNRTDIPTSVSNNTIPKIEAKAEKKEDEGVKPTMETRGPPPGNLPYGYMQPGLMRPPFSIPGYDPLAAGMGLGPLGPYGPPYLPPHLSHLAPNLRAPFGFPPTSMAGSPEDLSKSAAAMQAALANPALAAAAQAAALSQSPSMAAQALAQAAAAAASGGSGASATKTLDLLNQQAAAQQFYAAQSHKIHELQERAIKSPSGVSSEKSLSSPIIPSSSIASLSTATTVSSASSATPGLNKSSTDRLAASPSMPTAGGRKDSPSPSVSSGSRRSPPPLRHVHTHTHTHFGLGYPLLPPGAVPGISGIPGVPTAPPAAHTPLSSTGLSSHLLPGKAPSIPNFPPPPK